MTAAVSDFDTDALATYLDLIDRQGQYDPPGARDYCQLFLDWLASRPAVSVVDRERWRAGIFYLCGIQAYGDADVGKAIEYLQQSITSSTTGGDRKRECAALRALALCFEYQGRQDESIDCVFRAIEIAERLGDPSTLLRSLSGLLALYESQGAYAMSLETATRMHQMANTADDPFLIASTATYCGLFCGYLDRPTEGLAWLDKAAAIAGEAELPQIAMHSELYRMFMLHVAGRIDEAVACAEGQIGVVAELPAQNAAAVYVDMAEIHLSAGNLDRAAYMLDCATEAARGEGLKGHLIRFYDVSSTLHEARGRSADALAALRRHNELESELRGRQARARLVTVERRFAAELAAQTEELHHLRTVELVEKNEQLAALNHQKDEILDVVSHDLRNPLAAAQMLTEMLLGHDRNDTEVADLGRSLRSAIVEMGGTIDTLLHVQREDPPSVLSSVDAVVKRAVASIRNSAKSRLITVTEQVAPIDMTVDGALLRRSLDDVLWHTVQAAEDGAHVTVLAVPTDAGARVMITGSSETVHRDERSLYIARRLIERMRGTVTVTDQDVTVIDLRARTE